MWGSSLINWFWAALGLRCCVRALSGCREWRLLSSGARAPHCSGFSCFEVQALECCDTWVWWPGGFSWARDWTHTPCTVRWILSYWTTRKFQGGGLWRKTGSQTSWLSYEIFQNLLFLYLTNGNTVQMISAHSIWGKIELDTYSELDKYPSPPPLISEVTLRTMPDR